MQDVRFIVSAGKLKQGFRPKSYDDLFAAFVNQLVITPNQDYSTFGQGNVLPSSNIGPFLKDGLSWYVFDNNLGAYRPEIVPIDSTAGSQDAGQIIKTNVGGFLDPSFLNFVVFQQMAADSGASNTYQPLVTATTTQKQGKVYIIAIAQAIKTGNGDFFPAGIRITTGGVSIGGNVVDSRTGAGDSQATTIVAIAQDVLNGSTKTYALEGQANLAGGLTWGATGQVTRTATFNYINATSLTLLQTGA